MTTAARDADAVGHDHELTRSRLRRPRPPSEVRGLRKAYGERAGARRRRPDRRAAARCSRCSAPTAPARRRSSRSSRATARADAGDVSRARPRPRASASARSASGSASCCRRPGSTRRSPCARRSSSTAPPTRTRGPPTRCSSSSGSPAARTPARATLSGGQRRRLDLALGIAGDPELIFLDEPTTGFDPAARRQSWELIAGLRALGKTILLTTHYMDEAQHLADRVVVLADGRVIAEGTPDALGARRRRASSPSGCPSAAALPLPAGATVERGIVALPHRDADARPRPAARAGPPRAASSSRA